MGKRSSNFERIPRDFYRTPFNAVPPLIPHLRGIRTFAEPCAGDGALVRHLESFGLRCTYAGDIATRQDALARDTYGNADAIITNPPYTRELMHRLIAHFRKIAPTWLLLPADWMHNLAEYDEEIGRDGVTIRTKSGVREHPLLKHRLATQSFVVRSLHRLGLDIIPPRHEIGRPAGPYRGEA
jgi:hypothetical protein